MTGRLHALRWQAVVQQLVVVNWGSVREGRDLRRVLYLRLFLERPLQRCAVNSCVRLPNTRVNEGNVPL
jgi:hypothetical protein